MKPQDKTDCPVRVYLECGAFFRARRIIAPEEVEAPEPKTGRWRVTVLCFDPGSPCQRPRTEDGNEAECFACKCRRASGRKERRVFVTDGKGEIVRGQAPVPMITCLIKEQRMVDGDSAP